MKKSLGPKIPIYPAPVWVIGTYDEMGNPNAMTVSWAGICCSDPPAVAISLRQATYTYGNIMRRRAFTVSIPSAAYLKEVDCFGTISGKSADKFSLTGLTPTSSELVDAPYVKEFPVVLECRLLNTLEIGLHTQFIGQIMDVMVDEDFADEKGKPDLHKIKPLLMANLYYYHLGEPVGKIYSFAKKMQGPK